MNRSGLPARGGGWERSDARLARTLPEICTDLFLVIIQMRMTHDFGDLEGLRQKIKGLFQAMEQEGKRMRLHGEDVQDAKYVLTAFIDEVILNSNWALKEKWSGFPLQLEYFGDNRGGEEFFNRLERLRKRPEKVQLLEVYHLCLLLGFKGKIAGEGTQYLRAIVGDVAKDISRLGGTRAEWLSPNWDIPDDPLPEVEMAPPKRPFPWWIVAVSGLGAVLVLYILLWIIVGSDADDVVRQLNFMR